MIEEWEVREKLAEMLTSECDLDAFEDWLVQHSWGMHLDSSASAQELVSRIELYLSEYSNEHLNWAELRGRLLAVLDTVVEYPPHPFASSSSSSTPVWEEALELSP